MVLLETFLITSMGKGLGTILYRYKYRLYFKYNITPISKLTTLEGFVSF